MKDGTAQGVAKIRFTESCLEPEERIFEDPYASYFFAGSSIVAWMGNKLNVRLSDMMIVGMYHMLVGRTRIIDELVKSAIADGATQYVILGAGYDSRAYRLSLPPSVKIFEVDQPEVQELKLSKLAEVPDLPKVDLVHVPVDFNTQSLEEELRKAKGFDPMAKTVITLEGVSQYIPREATIGTITAMDKLCSAGSTFFLSYADQNTMEDPSKVCGDGYVKPESVQWVPNMGTKSGEPWISYFHQSEIGELFKSCSSFQLVSDISTDEVNTLYLEPVGRKVPSERLCMMERCAVAKKGQ